MINKSIIHGFSRLTKEHKIEIVAARLKDPEQFIEEIRNYCHPDPEIQQKFEEFSENTLANYFMPYGVAPNFLINNRNYIVPMVVEESSVVAAASNSAKLWFEHGGFHSRVLSMVKLGHVYFTWRGNKDLLLKKTSGINKFLIDNTAHLTGNMKKRGGGITHIEIIDMTGELENMFQLKASFNTADSMGANFINSCLEEFSVLLPQYLFQHNIITEENQFQVIMSILSNYTPDCLVECYVECDVSAFDGLYSNLTGNEFARKFEQAIKIAQVDSYRAATHNKGIFNGIDEYQSLTDIVLSGNQFRYTLKIPLAMGTVGGLTKNHPLAKRSLEILGNPGAGELMEIAAATGLANNFSAIRSLITSGIQKGHMKMHLNNILNFLKATHEEKEKLANYFANRTVSFREVKRYLENLRSG